MPRGHRTKLDRTLDKKERAYRDSHRGRAPSREDLEHEEFISQGEASERREQFNREANALHKSLAEIFRDAPKFTVRPKYSTRYPVTLSVDHQTIQALDAVCNALDMNRGRALDAIMKMVAGKYKSVFPEDESEVDAEDLEKLEDDDDEV